MKLQQVTVAVPFETKCNACGKLLILDESEFVFADIDPDTGGDGESFRDYYCYECAEGIIQLGLDGTEFKVRA